MPRTIAVFNYGTRKLAIKLVVGGRRPSKLQLGGRLQSCEKAVVL